MNNKNIYIGIIVAILIGVGGYFFPKSVGNEGLVGTVGSSVGTTFNTAKVAQVNLNPTIAATTTGILNTDGTDRYIESTYYICSGVGTSQTGYTGAGLANLLLNIATGTTQTLASSITNANKWSTQVSTSTPDSYVASTTAQSLWRVWPTATYLNFEFNATNTAACSVGVHYLGS